MNPVSILHIGDMHLGSVVSSFTSDKNIMRTREIEYTCITALRSARQYDIVLMSGDVFDSPDTSARVADMVLNAIDSCPETRFFYSCGNHDPYISPVIDHCVRHCPPNLHIFGPEAVERVEIPELGVCVHGISFASQHQSEPLLGSAHHCSKEVINLLCIHGELTESTAAIYNPISLSSLEALGFDYAALGHVHSFSGIRRSGNLTYAYCGIPEPRGFDECGAKGYICGTVDVGTADLKFVPACKRQYFDETLNITDIDDFPSLASAVARLASSKDDIYRITICGQNKIGAIINTEHLASFCTSFDTVISDAAHISYDFSSYCDEPTLKGQCAREAMSLLSGAAAADAELYGKACALLFDLFEGRGAECDD